MVVFFLCMGGKHCNDKSMEHFSHCTETKNGMLEIQREVVTRILAFQRRNKHAEEISLQSHWSFHEMLKLDKKITFL